MMLGVDTGSHCTGGRGRAPITCLYPCQGDSGMAGTSFSKLSVFSHTSHSPLSVKWASPLLAEMENKAQKFSFIHPLTL